MHVSGLKVRFIHLKNIDGVTEYQLCVQQWARLWGIERKKIQFPHSRNLQFGWQVRVHLYQLLEVIMHNLDYGQDQHVLGCGYVSKKP